MRFADLSQEATQELWDRWKGSIREILDEFNEDVYHGNGHVRENSYTERYYLLLETKKVCFYVFPMPSDVLILGAYYHKIQKEYLNKKFAGEKPSDGNRIGMVGFRMGVLEGRYSEIKNRFQDFLVDALKTLYRNYCVKPLF